MKKYLLLFIALSSALFGALDYTLAKYPYDFATYFELEGGNGRVITNSLNIRCAYDLYSACGDHIALGVSSAVSMRNHIPWAKMLTLYDAKGKKIGMIDGRPFVSSRSYFSFYNAQGELLAVAHLDGKNRRFYLNQGEKRIGKVAFEKNVWRAYLADERSLDPRFFKIFSAFVADSEGNFPSPEEAH